MSVSAVLRSPRSEVVISLASAGGWDAVKRYVSSPLLTELCESGEVADTQSLSKEIDQVKVDAPPNVRHTLSALSKELDGGADDESISVVG